MLMYDVPGTREMLALWVIEWWRNRAFMSIEPTHTKHGVCSLLYFCYFILFVAAVAAAAVLTIDSPDRLF